MPRKARIDAPGALHHIISRGIARKKVFDDNTDRNFFIDRLGLICGDTGTQCFAWALIPNYAALSFCDVQSFRTCFIWIKRIYLSL